ncbi:hypothetical protein BDY19DRAFT_951546 [Irpex rosettiformis]|uniref:Uncharacterized protein n=1 Tax=Irpex rosettiformis TaxID=378272 RepID=A0ACB8U180_9APHY|nr:hypothetical protein BDY19DRAFT_951546 [Irpex rosettiformis]
MSPTCADQEYVLPLPGFWRRAVYDGPCSNASLPRPYSDVRVWRAMIAFRCLMRMPFTLVLSAVTLQVYSQISAPACFPGYEWLNNNISQNPCLVNTYLCRTCRPPSEYAACVIGPIQPGFEYINYEQPLYCDCSTVEWMLLGACGACQGGGVSSWSTYQKNCTRIYLSQIPTDIPVNTSIPAWAYLPISGHDDDFNITRIRDFVESGDHPDSSAVLPASTLISFSAIVPSSQTTFSSFSGTSSKASLSSLLSSSTSSLSSASSAASSTNTASNIVPPIVGGIIGGIAGIAAIVGAFLYWFTRRKAAYRRRLEAQQAMVVSSQPEWKNESRVYNPNDPTTYPLVSSQSVTPVEGRFHHAQTPSIQSSSSPKVQVGDINYRGFPEVS